MNISVLGCGRWGSFIAWYLNKIGHNVLLWGRENSKHINEIKNNRKNEFLEFDKTIILSENLQETVGFSEIIIVSISSQSLRELMGNIKNLNLKTDDKTFVLCMKGIESSTGQRLSEVVQEVMGKNVNIAVWVGPGHVQDFASGIPNCMIIDSVNEDTKHFLIKNFSSPLIRFYYGTDLIGTEIGAAAKNVMGIAAGSLDGMNYKSLKGALMARGTREIARLIKAMGGNEMSAYGLAHLGDYEATLFSLYSNNRKFGECLVTKQPYEKLAEGAKTSHALVKLGNKYSVQLPICSAVSETVLGNISAKESLEKLFLRSIKSEF